MAHARGSARCPIDRLRYDGPVRKSLDPDVRLLQALADPTRLAIVRQLATEGETCACDFAACCEVAQPTVSHHLKVLREAGVVRSERRGTWIYYLLEPDAAASLAAIADGIRDGRRLPAGALGRRPATGLPAARPTGD